MAKLKIYKDKSPILRKRTINVKKVDKTIKTLISNMVDTMNKEGGIGLAAPQVGKSLKIICIKTKDGALVLLNPVLKKKSLFKTVAEEGCLSLPGFFCEVKRHKSIRIESLNQESKKVNFQARGLLARVIQHEIDHLDGILLTDKVKKPKNKKRNERAI